MVGTPQMAAAVDWAVEHFREIGVDSVDTEKFKVPLSWREGDTPDRRRLARAVRGPSRCYGLVAGNAAGRHRSQSARRRRRAHPGASQGWAKQQRARSCWCVWTRSRASSTSASSSATPSTPSAKPARSARQRSCSPPTRPHRLLYRHIHTVAAELDPVPSAVLAREDALRIGRLLDSDNEVRMKVSLPNEIGGPVATHNVVAEIKGSETPEEIVLLGAHLDSWDMGTGCLDNAVNAVLVLEAARAIVNSPDPPRRTIRFALFSGEEAGLFGSWAYVRKHRRELDRFSAVVVHDMGLGKISGYAVNGRAELLDPLREAMRPLGSRASDHTVDTFFGSDHFDFLLEGVPALVAMQNTDEYAATYHSAADTFDKVSIPELRDRAQIAALTVLGIANLPQPLGRRLERAEVGYLLEDTGIDAQMRVPTAMEAVGDRRARPRPGRRRIEPVSRRRT